MSDWRQKARDLIAKAWPLLAFLVLTIILLYPVSLHPASLVLGRPFDDVFESIWYLDWYQQALFELRISPLFQPDIFYPGGWELGFATVTPLFPILLSPITALLGAVTTYNLALIASTVLAAYGIYLLHQTMGGKPAGGLFGGLVYAFYANRQTFMHGYMNLFLASMFLPYMLLGIYQAVARPQARTRWLIVAGLAYALSIAAAWQYVYISTITLAVFGLVVIGPSFRREPKAWLKPFGAFALTAGLVAGPLLINGLRTRAKIGGSAVFPVHDLIATSTNLERLVVPSAWNPLFWQVARQTFPLNAGEDDIVTVGLITLILAIAGLILTRPWKRRIWALLALSLTGLLLMLGPFLKLQGETLLLNFPAAQALARAAPSLQDPGGGLRIPLPALLIYILLAPLRSFHHFGRLGQLLALGTGILAGLGISQIGGRLGKPGRLLFSAACLLLLLLEINTQPQPQVTSIPAMRRPVDEWLAALPEKSVIAEYPLWHTPKAQSLYFSTIHGQKMIHGYSIIWPAHFLEALPVLEQWPADSAIDMLEQLDVRYVLVHVPEFEENFAEERLPELLANDRLKLVNEFPRSLEPDELPTYLFGAIEPMADFIRQTYVLELQG